MASEILSLLVRTNLALAAAVVLALTLCRPVRALFGAGAAYGLWLIAPLAVLAVQLPARVMTVATPVRSVAANTPPALIAALRPTPMNRPEAKAPDSPKIVTQRRVPTRGLGEGLVIVWGIVALLAIGLQAERQRRFLKSLGRLRDEDGLLHAEHAGVGPAVIGAVTPRVVLPADFALRFTAEELAADILWKTGATPKVSD